MILFIGPLPPPLHGQALVTSRLLERMSRLGLRVAIVDTAGKPARRLLAHMKAAWKIVTGRGPVYLSLNSNAGLWLSAALTGLSRAVGRPTFVHHHSFAPAHTQVPACAALVALGGPDLTHIALSPVMADLLQARYPGLKHCLVVGNASFIETAPAAPRAPSGAVRLGFLGNLSIEKGFDTAAEVALRLAASGYNIEFWVAGPAMSIEVQNILSVLNGHMGERLKYVGQINSTQEKNAFYGGLDVLLFPSRYRNEAAPLVVLEAMASNVLVIATPVGCVPEMLGLTVGTWIDDIYDSVEALIHLDREQIQRRKAAAAARFAELYRQDASALESLLAKICSHLAADERP